MAAGLAADVVVLLHLLFIVFVMLGGFVVLRWPKAAWAHVPAGIWGAAIEFTGGMCPLTPLEQRLRAIAGREAYSGDFVARYLFPVLYPEGLTRDAQLALGTAVLVINAAVYWVVVTRARGAGRVQRKSPL